MSRYLFCFLAVILLICSMIFIPAQGRALPNREASEPTAAEPKTTRLLVLGRDRAADLTDSILILSVEESTGQTRVLQLPRDTYAAYTDRDYRKLNGACSSLGMNGMKTFLSSSLGVEIEYVISLDLDCVADLVDAVGGVDLEIPQEMHYSDPSQGLWIDFEPGMQHLDGSQAERFLRFRSGYANADLGRMDAQKQFLQAYATKCKSMGTAELMKILWSILPRMQTDLPLPEAIRLVRLFTQTELDEIPMMTAPGASVQGSSGAWYYSLNRAGMLRVVNAYLFPPIPVTEEEFDPNGVFDRTDHPDFHKIYTASDLSSEEGLS